MQRPGGLILSKRTISWGYFRLQRSRDEAGSPCFIPTVRWAGLQVGLGLSTVGDTVACEGTPNLYSVPVTCAFPQHSGWFLGTPGQSGLDTSLQHSRVSRTLAWLKQVCVCAGLCAGFLVPGGGCHPRALVRETPPSEWGWGGAHGCSRALSWDQCPSPVPCGETWAVSETAPLTSSWAQDPVGPHATALRDIPTWDSAGGQRRWALGTGGHI